MRRSELGKVSGFCFANARGEMVITRTGRMEHTTAASQPRPAREVGGQYRPEKED